MPVPGATAQQLTQSEWPWVRLGVLLYLEDCPRDDGQVVTLQQETAAHPLVTPLLQEGLDWPGYALKSHKDAKHLLHKINLLAEMGLDRHQEQVRQIAKKLLAHQDSCGAFQTEVLIPRVFGGDDTPGWNWMLCDAPLVLHALAVFGYQDEPALRRAADHLLGQIRGNGWPCASAFPKMQGPGRKDDPCPYANLVCLRALSCFPEFLDAPACRIGVDALLHHWDIQKEKKLRMFGIGTDFRKLKFPLIWYDILHVVEVLSRFPAAREDPRFQAMWREIQDKADEAGMYTPQSVWMAFRQFDFGQKKTPSPTLTLAVERIRKRVE